MRLPFAIVTVSYANCATRCRAVKLPILAVARRQCQRDGLVNRGVLQFAGAFVECFMRGWFRVPFGFSPKISTPVENTVEKQVKRSSCRLKHPVFMGFWLGEGLLVAIFRAWAVSTVDLAR